MFLGVSGNLATFLVFLGGGPFVKKLVDKFRKLYNFFFFYNFRFLGEHHSILDKLSERRDEEDIVGRTKTGPVQGNGEEANWLPSPGRLSKDDENSIQIGRWGGVSVTQPGKPTWTSPPK